MRPACSSLVPFYNKYLFSALQDSQKSILCFGMVARERCQANPIDGLRHPHHHGPLFCTIQHYWNKISKHSLEKYKVPLNAVCHDTYSEMFSYLKTPTAKKPLSELDNQIYYSPLHPQGDALQKILVAGEKSQKARSARKGSTGQGAGAKRERLPSLFEIIKAGTSKLLDKGLPKESLRGLLYEST